MYTLALLSGRNVDLLGSVILQRGMAVWRGSFAKLAVESVPVACHAGQSSAAAAIEARTEVRVLFGPDS
jgi:hypothetical protein